MSIRGSNPPHVLQIHSLHQFVTGTPSHLPLPSSPPRPFPPLSPRFAKPPQKWSKYVPRSCELEIQMLNRHSIYSQNFQCFASLPIPLGATTQPVLLCKQTRTGQLTRTGTVGNSRRSILWIFPENRVGESSTSGLRWPRVSSDETSGGYLQHGMTHLRDLHIFRCMSVNSRVWGA